MLRGLNNICDVYRNKEFADDNIGGAQVTGSALYYDVMCRISSKTNTRAEQAEGIDVTRTFEFLIWPSSYLFKVGDILIPHQEWFAGQRFIVKDMMYDSLGMSSPRGHLQLTCERVDWARSTQ